jgi:NIMA (never in mitosis gene a)-related kinase 1/4/5
MGVILYEMCMQNRPFDGTNILKLCNNIVNGEFKPVSGPYSAEIKKLIKDCLNKDPTRRPTVNSILEMPCIKSRIKKYLSDTI